MTNQKHGKRSIILVSVVVLGMTLTAGGALVYAQKAMKQSVIKDEMQAMADEETQKLQNYWSELYKDAPYTSKEIIKQVCEAYNLDYDTVKTKDVTREMFNYETALKLKAENETDSMAELEVFITDIYAFSTGSSESIIRDICERSGLKYETATVSDLSAEQLMDLQERAYETSDHPKN